MDSASRKRKPGRGIGWITTDTGQVSLQRVLRAELRDGSELIKSSEINNNLGTICLLGGQDYNLFSLESCMIRTDKIMLVSCSAVVVLSSTPKTSSGCLSVCVQAFLIVGTEVFLKLPITAFALNPQMARKLLISNGRGSGLETLHSFL